MLRGGTGLGKMVITAQAIRALHERGALRCPPGSLNPFPVLLLCPKTIKTTWQRTLKDCGVVHLVMVMSYGQIKNADGTAMFLEYVTEPTRHGTPDIVPKWHNHMRPALMVCDEPQALRNPDSMISKVVRYAPDDVWWIGSSATPWQRVSDAQTTVERCGVITQFNTLPCTRKTSKQLLEDIAYPRSPMDYNESAMKRLRDNIEDYIVELKGVKFRYPTKTNIEMIHFKTVEQAALYARAYEDYLRELWEKKRETRNHGAMARWVAMQKFQEKAELIRCDQLAERLVMRVKDGKQVITGSKYLNTCREIWRQLVKKHGVNPDRICFIVGGQTERKRQEMVDKFQSGNADYMIVTIGSGGAGISLHHDRAESRPRYIVLPFAWSAIDFLQLLGRGHRLTSLSPTIQEVLGYYDTVEERVMAVLKNKIKCIAKSVTAKEQFITMFEKASEDVDIEESDDINAAISEQKGSELAEGDPDKIASDEEIVSAEGYESVEELPTGYR